jgi:hypothetical protein
LLAGIFSWIVGGAIVVLAVGTMGLHIFLVRRSNPPHPPVD